MLIIDADERSTPELEREFRWAIRRTDIDGFYLNRRFWFLDGWINHCGYSSSWNLRLFRHRLERCEQIEIGNDVPSGDNEFHEHVLLSGRVEYLFTPWSITRFLTSPHSFRSTIVMPRGKRPLRKKLQAADEKSLRATPFETALERKRLLKKATMRAPFRPSLRFLYHYVWKQGFRDGYRGWVFCRLSASYERLIVLK